MTRVRDGFGRPQWSSCILISDASSTHSDSLPTNLLEKKTIMEMNFLKLPIQMFMMLSWSVHRGISVLLISLFRWVLEFTGNSVLPPIVVSYKLSTLQKCKYCQFCFSCDIRNEQNKWSTWSSCTHEHLIWNLLTSYDTIKKENYQCIEDKIGIDSNIANFVRLWKPRLRFERAVV